MVRPRDASDLRRLVPPVVAAALAAVYLIWQPPSLDLAAAEYRAWLFGHVGFASWDAQWYGGHHLPGYSVLFPPLASWLGPRVLGALAVVTAAWLFERIAYARYGQGAWLGATWFAVGAAGMLFSGRMTFALGLVPALGAVWALQRSDQRRWRAGPDHRLRRRCPSGCAHPGLPPGARASSPPPARSAWLVAAVALALLTPLASPVAALFLALAATAHALGERRASGLVVAAAALLPVALLAIAFPEGGTEPFVSSAFWPVIGFAAVALILLPREERTLRIGVALYALGATAAFVLDTPVGGNVVRIGALCAGPLAALVLWPRRTLALACLAPFLLWWQLGPAILDVRTANGDPSVHAAYYAPLLAELQRAGPGGGAIDAGRLEIPFTNVHWEARWAAPAIPLARGWERQLDRKVNPLFYDDTPLTAHRYRAWLDRMAVRWVAVPDVRLDYSAKAEARLIAGGLPYLRPIWRGAHWRLYEVADAAPLADPPARVIAADTDALTLAVPRPAGIGLRLRWTPYWAVVAGNACVEPDGDLTRLRVREAGTVRLATRFALGRINADTARCEDPNAVNDG
jgi:hypothetical protein